MNQVLLVYEDLNYVESIQTRISSNGQFEVESRAVEDLTLSSFESLENKAPDLILLETSNPGVEHLLHIQELIKTDVDLIPFLFLLTEIPQGVKWKHLSQTITLDFMFLPDGLNELLVRAQHLLDYKNYHKKGLQMETSIRQQADELDFLKQEQNDLMSIVSHDLKSPLSKLSGLTQLLPLVGELNEEQKKCLDMANEVIENGKKLIDEILTITAYDVLKGRKEKEKLNLPLYLQELIAAHLQIAQNKKISLSLKENTDLEVMIDKTSLSRIMDNLISNALKFTESGKSVELDYTSEAGYFQISVKDEGPGFSQEDRQKMFRKFQRLSARPTAGEASTGLGLSIVKSLVDRLEGEIILETELEKGSVFHIRFPIR